MKRKIFVVLLASIITSQVMFAQSGLYLRTQFWGSQLNVSWLFFAPKNKIVRNPLYGVNPLQIDKETANNASNVGTYTKTGDTMTIN